MNSRAFSPATLLLGIAPLFLLPAQPHAAETITITGDGSSVPFRFEPKNATVKPGDEVTWVNQTKVEHSVTPDPGLRKGSKARTSKLLKATRPRSSPAQSSTIANTIPT